MRASQLPARIQKPLSKPKHLKQKLQLDDEMTKLEKERGQTGSEVERRWGLVGLDSR